MFFHVHLMRFLIHALFAQIRLRVTQASHPASNVGKDGREDTLVLPAKGEELGQFRWADEMLGRMPASPA